MPVVPLLLIPGCGEDPVRPDLEEIRVTGTVRFGGQPRAVTVVLFHLGGVTPVQPLAESESGADGRYDVSADVDRGLCDFFYVAADFRPLGGEVDSGQVLSGCGVHTSDIDGT